MGIRSKYNTKQRDVLIEYFKTIPETHVTAGEVTRVLIEKGESIGQATVYRQLGRLVGEGVLKKYLIDGNSPACFEYVGDAKYVTDGICFHCKCEVCGSLLHVNGETLTGLKEHLLDHHGFQMDPLRTVFYGICEECARKQEGQEENC